ncbi:condensin subunit Smc [Desulfonispora thiosulfatigenes DSM 11270]|uniref:Chromosome partition protein Smc n=1 Tax=Desulfonispora thiosulfatigenes DSM 11270 TaxID=656914 RepID=A0A1W1VJY0_DESTI|nr:chromosome segregation protein SMC [Desulfonispora thiosulfatigenes]SMB93638.1 condensin subunit Smc [Desulfonispora thiosulfatigenes DSM 11270]
MHLKQLEIQGFKSFAEKVTLELTKGITAVVGPNGSGKSNVVDAIRWVLGEQSAKSLRGIKMDDIIFAGSTTKKAIGMAEVSLTFTNVEGTLPLDFNEINITRRLFRSGESEYLINKASCRLKDIYELFMDTGIGKEGFSIIGQGKIDEVLSLKPEDRRNLIEESAGIVKYRYRKTEAQKKLEDTDQTLIRVNDIMLELKEQLEPLNEQAKDAKQYNIWKNELDQLKINILLKEVDNRQKTKEHYQKQLTEIENSLTENNTIYHRLEANTSQLRLKLQEENKQVVSLQQDYYNLSSELEKNEHQIEITKERKQNYSERINRIEKEIETLSTKEQELGKVILESQVEADILKQKYLVSQENLERLTSDLAEKTKTLDESTLTLEKYQANILSSFQDSANITNQLTNISNELEYKHRELRQIAHNEEESNSKITELKEDYAKIQKNHELESKNKENLEIKLTLLEERLTKLEANTNQIKKEILDKQIELQKDISSLQVNKDMEESKEGYLFGVKSVLERKLPGIIGTVADIIKVPQKLELAIETVLGSSLQHLVAENSKVAEEAINYLKKEKKGRATFLPLDTVKGTASKVNFTDPNILGRAIELIEFNPKYKEVLEFILGKVLVVTDLANAVRLGKQKNNFFRMVTLEGDLIAPSGALTGGSYRTQKTGLISRKRIIGDLTTKIARAKNSLEMLTDELNKSEKEYEHHSKISVELKIEVQNKSLKLVEINNYRDNISKEIETLNIQNAKNETKKDVLNTEIKVLENRHKQLLTQRENLKLNSDNADKSAQDLKEKLKKLTYLKNDCMENLNKEKVNNATLLQEKRSLELRLSELEKNKETFNQDSKELKLEKVNIKDQIIKIEEEITKQQENKIMLINKLESENNKIISLKDKTQKISGEIDTLEESAKKQKKISENLNQEKHKNEIKLNKVEINLKITIDKLWEEFNLTPLEAQEIKVEEFDYEEAKRKINELTKQIENLGLVNFTAINEYERVQERLNFLSQQYNDLTEAKESLRKVISEMDVIMVKRFKEAFDLINTAFNQVFSELFGGGTAFLQLSDEKDLLNTGIEIIAKPPGKKPQSLSLLSGGERAMTAIALLLGILKIKPSPFCVLDEIDSALDEANVYRFAEYIKKFSQNTQFIIVSHRKGTMEIGDVLYGVTVENSGVSKLISVKLSDYDKAQ